MTTENFACIHSITPTGGAGKSKHINEHIQNVFSEGEPDETFCLTEKVLAA